ncbi:lysosomal Pro-X carboxypeptidase PRCP [Acrasis kona]|uniref:Lysosomal Pro-X carboxypeptidase PRCP n=1 Tax=Acrasis kona TaxID=1008807 RepID=A0AAW2ZJ78_9EUKA
MAIVTSKRPLLEVLHEINNVYYNTSGKVTCFDLNEQISPSLGENGWSYQACTEMVMPIGSYPSPDNLFLPRPWNLEAFVSQCKASWNVTSRPKWAATYYGGKDISASSNIVFSNGDLDPWMGGGITESISESIVAIVIKNGAHHVDLRSKSDQDPESVVQARQEQVRHITKWINQYRNK